MEDTNTNTPEPEVCEVLPDGRIGHYFRRDNTGIMKCVRCPAIAGRHGLIQPVAIPA